MTSIAPIGPVRVAAVRPATPGSADDPYEDGLDVEVVTEAAPIAIPDQVAPTAASTDADPGFDRRPSAASMPQVASVSALAAPMLATPAQQQRGRGNAAVATGFDPTPASDLGDSPRGSFGSAFARAASAYAGR